MKSRQIPFAIPLIIFLCSISFKNFGQDLKLEGREVEYNHQALDNSFDSYQVYDLNILELLKYLETNQAIDLSLVLGNDHNWMISMVNSDIRSDDYKLMTATGDNLQAVSSRRSFIYEGYIKNLSKNNEASGSEVRFGIRNEGLVGLILIGNQQYFIEPLSQLVEGVPNDYYLVYLATSIKADPEIECTLSQIEDEAPEISRDIVPINSCLELELALAATFDMFTKYGSVQAVVDHMLLITSLMEPLYAPFNLNFVVVGTFVPSTAMADPFSTSDNTDVIFPTMNAWFPGNMPTHDLGQLWTARDIRGCYDDDDPPMNFGLIGCAQWFNTVCEDERYNICEDFNTSFACLRALSAHEIGHNLDGRHGDANNTTIMWGNIVCNATTFTGASTTRIGDYIASLDEDCLAACAVPSNDLCLTAHPLTCGRRDTGTTVGASSIDAFDFCGDFNGRGVWFTVVGTGNPMIISTHGSSFDTELALLQGTCLGGFTCLAQNDDAPCGFDQNSLTSKRKSFLILRWIPCIISIWMGLGMRLVITSSVVERKHPLKLN